MAVNKAGIAGWFHAGVQRGATHMIIVCDTYSWEDYPVYVRSNESVRQVAREHGSDDETGRPVLPNRTMQKVMEIYSLKLDMELQLNEHQAWHWD